MQMSILAEDVKVTIIMEGIRTRVTRSKIVLVHPSTFEEAVDAALNAEFNFKAALNGTQYQNASAAEPMDLSYVEDESELHAAEH